MFSVSFCWNVALERVVVSLVPREFPALRGQSVIQSCDVTSVCTDSSFGSALLDFRLTDFDLATCSLTQYTSLSPCKTYPLLHRYVFSPGGFEECLPVQQGIIPKSSHKGPAMTLTNAQQLDACMLTCPHYLLHYQTYADWLCPFFRVAASRLHSGSE